MLDATFRAAFGIADEKLDEETRRRLMQRVYIGSYDRAAGNAEAGKAAPEKAEQGEAGTAPSKGKASKEPKPRPPR